MTSVALHPESDRPEFGRLHARCAGDGPLVVCLHSSAGSGQQWQALAETLAPRFRVACVDSFGHGRSPAADAGADVLAQDAAGLAPAIARAGGAVDRGLDGAAGGVHLVGHSYGAALAIRLALDHPGRVRSLTLYEPVLFSVLDDPALPADAREEIGQVGRAVVSWAHGAQVQRAARLFMDYWSGGAAWTALGARQQRAIVARMPSVAAQFEALFGAGIALRDVARLSVPTLLLSGARSRRPALAIAEALPSAWPHARVFRFDTLGHLGPITNPAAVNAEIVRHLDAVAVADAALPPRAESSGPSIMRPGEAFRLSLHSGRGRTEGGDGSRPSSPAHFA